VERLKEQFNNMSKTYENMNTEYGRIKTELGSVTHERDVYKEENKKLAEKNEQIKNQITNMTKRIGELQHEIKMDQEETFVFQIASGTIGVGLIGEIIDSIIAHIQLSNLEAELKKVQPYISGFNGLADSYENFEILRWKNPTQNFNRYSCFNGFAKENLKNCDGKAPTITTVHTADGYRFGAVLHNPWSSTNGPKDDPKACTFSANWGLTTTIHDPTHAMIVDDSTLIHFGETDIIVKTDRTGSATAKTYIIPSPHANTTFYYTGPTFTADMVTVDYAELK